MNAKRFLSAVGKSRAYRAGLTAQVASVMFGAAGCSSDDHPETTSSPGESTLAAAPIGERGLGEDDGSFSAVTPRTRDAANGVEQRSADLGRTQVVSAPSDETVAAWLESLRQWRQELDAGQLTHDACLARRALAFDGWQDARLAMLDDDALGLVRGLYVDSAPRVLALLELDRVLRAADPGPEAIASEHHRAVVSLQPRRARAALGQMAALQQALAAHARASDLPIHEHPAMLAYMNLPQPGSTDLWQRGDAAVLHEAYRRLARWAGCADREHTDMPGLRRLVARHGHGEGILGMSEADLDTLEECIRGLGDLPLDGEMAGDGPQAHDERHAAAFGAWQDFRELDNFACAVAIACHKLACLRRPKIPAFDVILASARERAEAGTTFSGLLEAARDDRHRQAMAAADHRHQAEVRYRREQMAAEVRRRAEQRAARQARHEAELRRLRGEV